MVSRLLTNGHEVQTVHEPGVNRVELPINSAAVSIRIQCQ